MNNVIHGLVFVAQSPCEPGTPMPRLFVALKYNITGEQIHTSPDGVQQGTKGETLPPDHPAEDRCSAERFLD